MHTDNPNNDSIHSENNDDTIFIPKRKKLDPRLVLSGLILLIFISSTGLAFVNQNQNTDSRSQAAREFRAYCTGVLPENATSYTRDDVLTGRRFLTWKYSTTNTTRKCEFTCNTGYMWENGQCVTAHNGCEGIRPANTIVYPGDDNPTTQINWRYSNTNTNRMCQYACDDGYNWNGSSCIQSSFSCTGSIPAGSVAHDAEEQQGLNSDTPWTYRANDSATKCQYKNVN